MGSHTKCGNEKKTSIAFAFSGVTLSACLCQLIPMDRRIMSLFFQDIVRPMTIKTFRPGHDACFPSMAIRLVMTLMATNLYHPLFRFMILVHNIFMAVTAGDPIPAVNRGAVCFKRYGKPAFAAPNPMAGFAFFFGIGMGSRKSQTYQQNDGAEKKGVISHDCLDNHRSSSLTCLSYRAPFCSIENEKSRCLLFLLFV